GWLWVDPSAGPQDDPFKKQMTKRLICNYPWKEMLIQPIPSTVMELVVLRSQAEESILSPGASSMDSAP
ncbi:MAG: hypothetical protein HUK20_13475, partial [Fibrobacter sp.]|nr:hypothetical protein [Fibrobacter sp.]